jgi:hypothetical protein
MERVWSISTNTGALDGPCVGFTLLIGSPAREVVDFPSSSADEHLIVVQV